MPASSHSFGQLDSDPGPGKSINVVIQNEFNKVSP